jgi:plastocyanin
VWSAGIDLVVVLIVGLALRDREALAFAVVLAAGLALLRFRRGLLGRVLLFLVFLDIEFWMLPAGVSNVSHRGALKYVVVPMALAVASLAGLVAVTGAQRGGGGGAARTVAVAAVAAFVVAVGVSRLPGVGQSDKARAGDLTISAKNVKFSTTSLAGRAGRVAVRFTNHDLFWHTFTVDRLGVDLRVPVGGARRVAFTAPPGAYEFHCSIPGHKSSMHGTLTIS